VSAPTDAFDPARTLAVRCTRRCGRVTFFAPHEPTAGHVCQTCCDADARKAGGAR